ncbi:Spr-1 [Aphelenchoides besseyi]|nr:Spr-1 [Aphelenchoides besseyi]
MEAAENRVTRSSARTKNRSDPRKQSGASNSRQSNSKTVARSKPTENANTRVTRSTAKPEVKKRVLTTSDGDEGPRKQRNITVGTNFQATLPDCKLGSRNESKTPDRDECTKKVREYCEDVQNRLNVNNETALQMLYKNNFNFKDAEESASRSRSFDDTWTENDVFTFYGLFAIYGRDFAKIHKVMAHKSIRSLIEHYYRVKLRINYISLADSDTISYELNRKISTEEPTPAISKPSICQNCGAQATVYLINNQLQQFNCNRTVDRREKPIFLKYKTEVKAMVERFKELCEPQANSKSKCEDIKQKAIRDCRMLRGVAMRKEANATKVSQRLAAETNIKDYTSLLTVNNASSSKLKISAIWSNNEKHVAAIKLEENIVEERRRKTDVHYKEKLDEIEKDIDVVDLE